MHRIDGVGATAGNKFQKGTLMTVDFMNDSVQEELANVIEPQTALVKVENDQLVKAIQAMIDAKIPQTTSSVRAKTESSAGAGVDTQDSAPCEGILANTIVVADEIASLTAWVLGSEDIGSIYMQADDSGGGPGDQVWVASLVRFEPDAGNTETKLIFKTHIASGVPPTDHLLQWDNNWVTVYTLTETGGTYARMEARAIIATGDVQFRMTCASDGAADTAQSQIGFTAISF